MFLVLLVLFLAAAIMVNFHLLMTGRDAVLEETGERVLLEGESVIAKLGLSAAHATEDFAGAPGGVTQPQLARLAREQDLSGIEILSPDGRVRVSSYIGRAGHVDVEYASLEAAGRHELESGQAVLSNLRDTEGIAYATLSGFLPLVGPSGKPAALLKIEEHAGELARLQSSLRILAAVQAAGVCCLVLLVLLFARWLLAPYRQLMSSAAAAAGGGEAVEAEDDLLATFQRVTEKLQAQEDELVRLRGNAAGAEASGLPAESLAASLTSGMLAFDAQGVVRLANPAALQILGVNRAEVSGKMLPSLFEGSTPLGRLLSEALRDQAPRSREMVPFRRADGREIHLGVGVSPMDGPAGGGGLVCLLSDLTEIRHLRDRVALKENLSHLGELSAGIAHEFRNSLATLQGYARLMERSEGNEASELARLILREVEGSRKVVEEFLQFARPAPLQMSEVDLRGLIEGLCREFSSTPGGEAIAFRVTGEFPRFTGDETQLRRAFQNLLLNATQARNGRPLEIEVMGAVEEGKVLRIDVADNGVGILPETLPRIFTPFFTTRSEGTGLGLPLVQKAIVGHDGSIEVASQPGQGTRFVIRLPLAPASGSVAVSDAGGSPVRRASAWEKTGGTRHLL
jgi:PAS domain S-box-containing protein